MMVIGVGHECPFKAQDQNWTIMDQGDIYFGIVGDNFTTEEARAIQFGQWWFSIRKEQSHIVLVAKIKEEKSQLPAMLVEYVFSLNKVGKEHWESFLSLEVGQAYPIHFMLIERKTNFVKAFRMFGLSRRANQFMRSVFSDQVEQVPNEFNPSLLPSMRKSFDLGLIKEKAGTK